jgi:hypothetical protein
MADVVHELVVPEAAVSKLAARSISRFEVEQTLHNRPVIAPNRRGPAHVARRLLIGVTDGGRPLTLVIEATLDPTTWLVITGWETTPAERKIGGV